MRLLFVCFLFLLVTPIIFGLVALESYPAIDKFPPTEPSNAAKARDVLKRFRNAFNSREHQRTVAVSQSEINSVLMFAGRAVPSFRGRATVTATKIKLAVSAKPPRLPGNKWLNLDLAITPSTQGLDITSIRVGPFDLPPGLVLPVLALAMDTALDDELGTLTFNGVERVSVQDKTVSVGINISPDIRKAVFARSKERLRAFNPFGEATDIRGYYVAMHAAAEAGKLPRRGSFTPYLHFALDMARQQAAGDDVAVELRSTLLAVGVYCGIRRLEILVGTVVPGDLRKQPAHCRRTTLGGRGDLRQHFIVSAVLRVASYTGVSFTIGEFKELLDANKGGSGFSFDDVAADLPGIRFAATLFADGTAGPKKLLDRMATESQIFPDI